MELLLENIPNALSHAERLNEFLVQTHLNLGYCFDVGHAHMGRGIGYEFDLMKDRIKCTNIHDNNGKTDSHLFPGHGTIDWAKTMGLLHSRGEQFPLLLGAERCGEHGTSDRRSTQSHRQIGRVKY